MSIWIYRDKVAKPLEDDVTRERCLFCESEMFVIYENIVFGELKGQLKVCRTCGWWCKNRRSSRKPYQDEGRYYSMWGACAQLKSLDLSNICTPIEDVKQYLVAKYEDRLDVNPRIYEEVVGSVFKEFGYSVEVTAYQNDGGIDVVLSSTGDRTIGVQVKRYRNKIEVNQIRAFAGALILSGHTSGIYVTTSSYQSGALVAAKQFDAKGIPIKLIDAQRFYDALCLVQREPYEDYEEFYHEIQNIDEHLIYKDEGPYGI